jgi:hypothetical protein
MGYSKQLRNLHKIMAADTQPFLPGESDIQQVFSAFTHNPVWRRADRTTGGGGGGGVGRSVPTHSLLLLAPLVLSRSPPRPASAACAADSACPDLTRRRPSLPCAAAAETLP